MISEEQKLKQKVFKLIDDKNNDLMKVGNHLNVVSDIIKQLNKFINNKIELLSEDISELLKILIHYRVVLDIPIPSETLLLRAVKFDDPTKYPYEYENASRISYIPKELLEKAKLGRFNHQEQSMYYGSISKSLKDANVTFSEVGAKENEYINLLISKTSKKLKVRYIGLFEYYKRGLKPPFQVHSFFKEVYKYYQSTHTEELLTTIELCDSFFTDITTGKGSDCLYKVTSILASILLEDSHVDGLIYPSVETTGSVNLVLKPKSVDTKVVHKEAKVALITKDYGYSIYYAMDFNKIGIIDINNNITWTTNEN